MFCSSWNNVPLHCVNQLVAAIISVDVPSLIPEGKNQHAHGYRQNFFKMLISMVVSSYSNRMRTHCP